MSQSVVGAIISGVVAISAVILGKTDIFNRDQNSIVKDTELYRALPDESQSKRKLLKWIDEKVESYITNETKLTRDLTGVILGLAFIGAGGYLSWFFIEQSSWWRIGLVLSIFMVILGVVGLVQDASKLERDHKGRPLKK